MERRKKAAAYQVSLSAVKNVHVAKSGIETARDINPADVDHLGFCLSIRKIRTIKKTMS